MRRLLADRYELDKRIGRGAMGEVWSARDRVTGAEVAVKLAQAWTAEEAELLARFEREGELLRRLRSPHVCALLDAGRADDNTSFLVLERLHGETLEALLDREGYLPMDEVARIAHGILLALVEAHAAGIVHRDLSPANVFLHRAPDGGAIVKVLDFGVAKAKGEGAPATGKGATIGSLPYVAPEQLGQSATAGPRADLYALGTIVFRALTGRMPYGEASGAKLVVLKREADAPSLDEATGEAWPAAMRAFVAKALARTPSKRHASAEVALAALEGAVKGPGPRLEVPDGPRDATTTLGGPPRRRSK